MYSSAVGKQVTSKLTNYHCTGGFSGTNIDQPTSSEQTAPTSHSSGLGSSGGAAGGSSHDPNRPLKEVSHLAVIISEENEFADEPHQIIPTEEAFTLPLIP